MKGCFPFPESATRDAKESDNVVCLEPHMGRFYRSFSFPNKVNSEKIEARFENGVLLLTVPKLKETKPQKIKHF